MKPIHPEIIHAETLAKEFYLDDHYWTWAKEAVFSAHWMWLGMGRDFDVNSHNAFPISYCGDYVSEPLFVVKADLRIFSNVCTHRAFPLIHEPTMLRKIVCRYHGRRFGLDGRMDHMPEFEGVEDFPRPCDHLSEIPRVLWRDFLWSSLAPQIPMEQILGRLEPRVGFLPFEDFVHDPSFDRIFEVKAHWALYVENYLEGFHVPFVHQRLGGLLDFGSYTTECDEWFNVQIGYATDGTPYFDLPHDHMDFPHKVAAYYYWIFPNTMLNIYPWGLQMNQVIPVSKEHTQVIFKHYIWNRGIWEQMKAEEIGDITQVEDEWVVEGVQRGLKSRYYQTGRLSAKRESGVHHFHRIISNLWRQTP